jgi:hypothetical protein
MEWKKDQIFESDITFVAAVAGGSGRASRLKFYFSALGREESIMATRCDRLLRVMIAGRASGRFRMVGKAPDNPNDRDHQWRLNRHQRDRTIGIVEVW